MTHVDENLAGVVIAAQGFVDDDVGARGGVRDAAHSLVAEVLAFGPPLFRCHVLLGTNGVQI